MNTKKYVVIFNPETNSYRIRVYEEDPLYTRWADKYFDLKRKFVFSSGTFETRWKWYADRVCNKLTKKVENENIKNSWSKL